MTRRLRVTDHALVRYLERVGGFEIEILRSNIAARLQPYADLGAESVLIDGHAYIISHSADDGPSVVTVVPVTSGRRYVAKSNS